MATRVTRLPFLLFSVSLYFLHKYIWRLYFSLRFEPRWKETSVAEGASGEVVEGAGCKGLPSGGWLMMFFTFPASGFLPWWQCSQEAQNHVEDWARCQIWASSLNWTQTKTFSREALDDDDDCVNNLPVLCKLNMRTLALKSLMDLCRRGYCAEANSPVNGSVWQKCVFPSHSFPLQPSGPHSQWTRRCCSLEGKPSQEREFTLSSLLQCDVYFVLVAVLCPLLKQAGEGSTNLSVQRGVALGKSAAHGPGFTTEKVGRMATRFQIFGKKQKWADVLHFLWKPARHSPKSWM